MIIAALIDKKMTDTCDKTFGLQKRCGRVLLSKDSMIEVVVGGGEWEYVLCNNPKIKLLLGVIDTRLDTTRDTTSGCARSKLSIDSTI